MDEELGLELGLEFERDFCIAINMMLGKTYEEAVREAREWVEEAHSDE